MAQITDLDTSFASIFFKSTFSFRMVYPVDNTLKGDEL